MDSHIKLIIAVLLLSAAPVLGQGSVVSEENVTDADRIQSTKTNHVQRVVGSKTVNVSQAKWAWRVLHNGTEIIDTPFFSNGETWTPHKIIEAKTLSALKGQILKLKLKIPDNLKAAYDALEERGIQ